jgi:uncharacterized protein involved in outer membrane biogenesis
LAKKIVLGIVLLLLVAGIGVALWARSVLTTDAVRVAVAGQLSRALGQPVRIGGISASIFPRVVVVLDQVTIGDPARIAVGNLHVGTDFRALLSRRIEHATVRLTQARVELPLPSFTRAPTSDGTTTGRAPIEIVSVDEILLQDAELISGGRTLRGDVEVVPDATGIALRRVALSAGGTNLSVTGRITDLAGPVGELTVRAGSLNALDLLAFLSDFSTGVGPSTAGVTAAEPAPVAPMNLTVALEAERATFGMLLLNRIAGRARVTTGRITVDPVRFGVFDGEYEGTIGLTPSDPPQFTLGASVSGIDMATVMQFAGSPGSFTGRLSGRIDVTGRGASADAILKTAAGNGRVEIREGSIKGLGLVRAVVLAGSMRADSRAQLSSTTTTEPFSRLSATLTVAGGSATTRDLLFESKDLLLSGTGQFLLDGSAVNIGSRIQLSDELSKQAGRDLLRYTQENGRVTLPASVTGSLEDFDVSIDFGGVARRAITNRAAEEAKKAIQKGLGGLLKRGQ